MGKIFLDIIIIMLFFAVAGLQIYVIFRMKELKKYYSKFIKSEDKFVKSIEKARQSLMIVNSQATDIMPDLKVNIDRAESLMQDFSFVMSRVNKKIDHLERLSASTVIPPQEKEPKLEKPKEQFLNNSYPSYSEYLSQETDNINSMSNPEDNNEEVEDNFMKRLAKKENEENYVNPRSSKYKSNQEELVEKALREIL